MTRAVGRSTLGELSTFELLLYVTMGDLVQQGVTQQDYSVTGAVLAVGTFATPDGGAVVDPVAVPPQPRPDHRARRCSWSATVRLDEATMRRQRLSVADLLVSAREQGIRRTSDIEYAVLEADGRISFFTFEQQPQSGAAEKPPEG